MERLQKKTNKRLNNKTLNPLQCQSFMMEKNKITKMSIMITIIITNRRTWKFSLQHTRTKILLDYMTLWSSQHEPLRGVQGQEVVTEAQDIGQLGTHIINPPPWTQQNSVLIKGTEREIIIATEQAWKTIFWLLGEKTLIIIYWREWKFNRMSDPLSTRDKAAAEADWGGIIQI